MFSPPSGKKSMSGRLYIQEGSSARNGDLCVGNECCAFLKHWCGRTLFEFSAFCVEFSGVFF